MFKKVACFILPLCVLSLAGHAQKNLKEAAVVFNNADTAKGYIDYKEWLANPTFILFTNSKTSHTTRYNIGDVSWFNLTGIEQFKRYTVNISMDQVTYEALGDKDTSTETKTVFLRVMATGNNVTLFAYRDKIKTRYYLLQAGDAMPAELLNTTYLAAGKVQQERQYRTNLHNAALKYLPNDGSIISQIDRTDYYGSDIAAICLKLNGLPASPKTVGPRLNPWRFFVEAGINQGKLNMVNFNTYYSKTTGPRYTPVVGAGIDYVITPGVGRLVVRAQVDVSSYKISGRSFHDYTQYTEEYIFNFKQTNVAVVPQFLYNVYNQKQLKWFISAGMGFNFSSYPLNQEKHTRTSSAATTTVTSGDIIKLTENLWMNGCFTTGINISRLQVCLAYFTKSSITRTRDWGIDNSSLRLKVGFYLAK